MAKVRKIFICFVATDSADRPWMEIFCASSEDTRYVISEELVTYRKTTHRFPFEVKWYDSETQTIISQPYID